MTQTTSSQLEALTHLIETVRRLRAPGGCPWDRAQTHQSLRQYLIEEAYEVLDVLDQIRSPNDLKVEKTRNAFCEELGDLLMQVLLHSEMASEEKAFDIYSVAKGLDEKLIRRHPHVFGEVKAADSADIALQQWEKEKAKEKATQLNASILDGVPRGLPSLQKAARVLEKVTKVGFQWKDMEGPIEKVEEEWAELKAEVLQLEKEIKNSLPSVHLARKKVEAELGDLLFTLCNVSYLLKVNPEDALRGTLARFENRFRHVELRLKENGKSPEQSDLGEMDQYWDEAKQFEKVKVWGLTGGIGAGKTTAARYFTELGIPVIDADQIARDLTTSNETVQKSIQERFGTTDRAQLRDIVFQDSKAKSDLEAILHPLIQLESRKRIRALSGQHPVVIYEAALLVETGRHQNFAGLIVIEAPREIRLKRILERPGMTLEAAKRIVDSQASDEDRRKYAHQIIENAGDLETFKNRIQKWVQEQQES